jgi:hypothetical protein
MTLKERVVRLEEENKKLALREHVMLQRELMLQEEVISLLQDIRWRLMR